MMKKLYSLPLTAIIILTSFLSSCEKDVPLNEAIIGRWEVQSYKYIIYESNVKKSEVTIFMEPKEMEIQFAEGGAGLMYEFGQLAGNFTWTLSGSTVTALFGDGTYSWEITIKDDTLVWTYDQSEVENNITYNYEFFYTAVKVS
jgi:hypothetical protein